MGKLLTSLTIFSLLLSFLVVNAAVLQPRAPPTDLNICPPARGVWCNNECCPKGNYCSNDICKPGSPPPPPPPKPPVIWTTDYYTPQTCSDGACSSSSANSYARIQVHGSGFTASNWAFVGIYPVGGGAAVWTSAAPVGASWVVKSGVVRCSASGIGAKKAYVEAYDRTTGLRSNRVEVNVGCALW